MEHKKFQHNKDKDGSCGTMGFSAEQKFKELAENKGYDVQVCGRQLQFSHVDFILNKDGKEWRVDVKGAKRLRRADEQPSFEFVWLEFRTGHGKEGWLTAEKGANQIAFEMENEFVIVSRKDLLKLAEKLCDLSKKVDRSHKALYSGFKRFGRQDLLSLIKASDLKKIKNTTWEKSQNQ